MAGAGGIESLTVLVSPITFASIFAIAGSFTGLFGALSGRWTWGLVVGAGLAIVGVFLLCSITGMAPGSDWFAIFTIIIGGSVSGTVGGVVRQWVEGSLSGGEQYTESLAMQFRLSTVLLTTLVVATSLALAAVWGVLLAAYIMVLVVSIVGWQRTANWRLAVVAILGIVPALAIPAGRDPPYDAGRRTQCENNLYHIGHALRHYSIQHHRFPPPGHSSENSARPACSWRVAVLPYLDNQSLYDKYNFNEAWNGPSNISIANLRFPYLSCPSDPSQQRAPFQTNYLAVTGRGTPWEPDTPVPSGPHAEDRRVLIIEVANSGVCWIEPKDLTLDQVMAGVNAGTGLGNSGHQDGPGANVLLADGRIIFVRKNTPPKLLHALLTGKASVAQLDQIQQVKPKTNFLGYRLLAWLISVIVLFVHELRGQRKKDKAENSTTIGLPTATPRTSRESIPRNS